jgi:hypothetical protein
MSCCGKARAEAVARIEAAKEKVPTRRTIEFDYPRRAPLNILGPVLRRFGSRITVGGRNRKPSR